MNVFTLNSPVGHSAWYVGCTRACVRVCIYVCPEVAFTPPGVHGNANRSDDTVIDTDEGWVGGL